MAHEMFRSAPETNAAWAALPAAVRDAVAGCDAERLEVERSRVAPELRERITSPVYSVQERFASWERVVRRMEPGWASDDFYPISAYANDLDSRDSLGQLMNTQLAEAREGSLSRLLSQLDERFVAATVPDPEHSLRAWVRPTRTRPEAELGVWWKRRPLRDPWD
ncbi:hypothetical protein [Streptomyces sp. NBC_01428]|uniref:hypothetical protein n=1 Tax=Streptomyces sp. NBC_01428 TaxID=2903861 RepID=UPI002E35A961|nr:hypothetical protein [Streptomyces sp. NBC_01428]